MSVPVPKIAAKEEPGTTGKPLFVGLSGWIHNLGADDQQKRKVRTRCSANALALAEQHSAVMSSSCGDGGCTTKYGTDRLSVPNIAAKACYEPFHYEWISEAKMLWLCIFMVNFSGRLRQLVRSSLCGPRRGIPLLTPRLPHTCYEEGLGRCRPVHEIPGSLN